MWYRLGPGSKRSLILSSSRAVRATSKSLARASRAGAEVVGVSVEVPLPGVVVAQLVATKNEAMAVDKGTRKICMAH